MLLFFLYLNREKNEAIKEGVLNVPFDFRKRKTKKSKQNFVH